MSLMRSWLIRTLSSFRGPTRCLGRQPLNSVLHAIGVLKAVYQLVQAFKHILRLLELWALYRDLSVLLCIAYHSDAVYTVLDRSPTSPSFLVPGRR